MLNYYNHSLIKIEFLFLFCHLSDEPFIFLNHDDFYSAIDFLFFSIF